MTVQICIGSACHLKGSYHVISQLKTLIESHQLDSQVTLKSSFCLGACSGAVSVKIDDQAVIGILPNQTEVFFEEQIVGGLHNEIHRV